MKRNDGEVSAMQDSASHRWESADPNFYLGRLRKLCRHEAASGWCNADILIAAAVGAHVERYNEDGLRWLQNFACTEIQKQLAARGTVIDQVLAIYNLTTRTLEALKPIGQRAVIDQVLAIYNLTTRTLEALKPIGQRADQ